ncbi:MAG: efflux RND transporter periplasmic adaptor subunit [Wujia sp.]
MKKTWIYTLALACCLITGCAKQKQQDLVAITIPQYEKITYETTPAVYGDIEPELCLKLMTDDFENKSYFAQQDEMKIHQVYVKEGDTVQAGDVLIDFEAEEIEEEKRSYQTRYEENQLLIEHYKKLGEIQGMEQYEESIKNVQQDQQIVQMYLQELNAKLDTYSIKAEGTGIVSIVSTSLNYGYVNAKELLVKVSYGSNEYHVETSDDYAFEIGQKFTATYGVADYEVVLTEIEELASDTDAGKKRKLTFELQDVANRPNSDFLNLTVKKPVLKNVLYVPESAVLRSNDKTYVYVMDKDGFRHGVEVTIGSTVDGYTVIESGIKEGDLVVY